MEHDLSAGYPPFGESTLTIQLVTAFVTSLEQSEFLFCTIDGSIEIPQNALWLEFSSIHMEGVTDYIITQLRSNLRFSGPANYLFCSLQ